jgi:hypothetical protein
MAEHAKPVDEANPPHYEADSLPRYEAMEAAVAEGIDATGK